MTCKGAIRYVTFALIASLLINTPMLTAEKPINPAAMKAKIVARGEGQDVRVTLADKSQVKGFILSIHEQDFVLKAKGPGEPRTIEYSQITGVHKGHMSTGAKIGIGVGIGVVGIIAASFIAWRASGW